MADDAIAAILGMEVGGRCVLLAAQRSMEICLDSNKEVN
ncbi:hypothetical protein LINPERHAP1_LOCUS22410 [Linum perenne]